MSLLDKAKAHKHKRRAAPVDRELLDLALAYARCEITQTQAGAVMGVSGPYAATSLARFLCSAVRAGQVTITLNEDDR